MGILKDKNYLPILKMNDGSEVTKENWSERRKEMLELLEKYSYGHTPKAEVSVRGEAARPNLLIEMRLNGEITHTGLNHCGGKCKEEYVDVIYTTPYGEGRIPIQIFTPIYEKNPPVMLHIAFGEFPHKCIPLEEIIDHGYALVVVDYRNMMNDNLKGDYSGGIAAHFGTSSDRDPEEWGKIGMWAWGTSRVMDYLIAERKDFDTSKVAVIGHSRLGKTALWCGAQDERFAAVISNNSGYGGAASSKDGHGERVRSFVSAGSWDWFCENFKSFIDAEDEKPYDQSFLLALVAPRYLLVGSANEDIGADPASEFFTTLHASSAWELLGEKGLVAEEKMPEVGAFLGEGNVLYHYRTGHHYLTRTDWNAYIKFLDRKFKKITEDNKMGILKEKNYLPILKMNDGSEVTKENWAERRKEMLELLEKYSYGHTPKVEVTVKGETARPNMYINMVLNGEKVPTALNHAAGKCREDYVDVVYTTPHGEGRIPIQVYTPVYHKNPPVMLHIAFGEFPNKFIPLEEIMDHGYALVVVDYKNMINDNHFGDFSGGIAEHFGTTADRTPEEWGKIGMWAWGTSRVLDYLIAERKDFDTSKVAVIGHSRLGKTALWCGAQDERFAAVISNNSGYGGAASSKDGHGERVNDFLRAGSWDWFCENFKDYIFDLEDKKPYDQSFVSALVAPRYLLVGSAELDRGADPESEFFTTLHASSAWELLGEKGLVAEEKMPEVGAFLGEGNVLYHYRTGHHYLSREDWNAYFKFLDDKFKR